MDLKDGNITVGELLDNPQAKAVFQRRFGNLLSHPMVAASRNLRLKQLVEMARTKLSPEVIQSTLDELKQL